LNILIPMAGVGKRFADAGYQLLKPAILTTDWRTGKKLPMVLCALKDLPCTSYDLRRAIFVVRNTPEKSMLETQIKKFSPKARFVGTETITEGQASTCLLAKEMIDNNEELLVASCDNGMIFSHKKFFSKVKNCDAIVFTHRHNPAVIQSPKAYGWMHTDGEENVTCPSIKKAISDNPLRDHAVVGSFWFKRGCDFVKATQKMIAANDRIDNEFYVDQAIKYLLEAGMCTKVFEIDRYLGWGTPSDYENFEKSYAYWREFMDEEESKCTSN